MVLTLAGWQNGYAEDCKSFDIGSIPVPASKVLFRLSSVVEQSAVNRLVAGSSPAVGAILQETFSVLRRSFLCFKITICLLMRQICFMVSKGSI